jgi:hypothetical protein
METKILLSVEELYALAGVISTGATRWGDDVPCKQPGVYVISIEDEVTDLNLPVHERAFWVPDQKIIYIGRAKQLRRRLHQFRRHVYGRTSPHRGGQAILLLDCVKTVTWAETPDYGNAEAALIDAFHAKTGRKPFGNRLRSAMMSLTA